MKKIFILAVLFTLYYPAQAQEEDQSSKESFLEKVYFGGTFWMSFSDDTFIDVSPLIGYPVTERLNVAVGAIYNYTKRQPQNFTYHDYGLRIISIYKVYNPFFAQVEYEYMNYQSYNFDYESLRRINSAVNVGAGFSQNLGRNIHVLAALLYNVTYVDNDFDNHPYQSPWTFRVGVTAGF